MKKIISLIKACMSDNMSLFKIKTKNQNRFTKAIFAAVIAIICFLAILSYANMFIEPLIKVNLEFVLLTLFVCITSIVTLVEGIYKSSNLLFNCKDDDMLLSLPIKKSTVLFIRIFKFYIFELIYNSLFLLPAMVIYAYYVRVGITYYLVSIIALILLPIIPILVSCIIGGVISESSSRFKLKSIAQIVITTILLLLILYLSFNLENIITNIAENANSINDLITKLYYPAGAYTKLVTDFNISDLLIFIFINILLFFVTIIIFSKIYFKINSKVKVVKTGYNSSDYKIKERKPLISLISKELNKFMSSPVFVVNTVFGLVLFILGCILISIKLDSIINVVVGQGLNITENQIKAYVPVLLFGFVCFTSLMSSITSSMISLEGKSFNILKSLPVKPFTVIISKILTAVLIMIPIIFVGDLIIFIVFEFNLLEVILILITSIVLPIVSETIGILVNLKYPKMDAESDTQVVKQSISSTIAVFIGIILTGATGGILVKSLQYNFSVDSIILCGLGIYTILAIGLFIYLQKNSEKKFEDIEA